MEKSFFRNPLNHIKTNTNKLNCLSFIHWIGTYWISLIYSSRLTSQPMCHSYEWKWLPISIGNNKPTSNWMEAIWMPSQSMSQWKQRQQWQQYHNKMSHKWFAKCLLILLICAQEVSQWINPSCSATLPVFRFNWFLSSKWFRFGKCDTHALLSNPIFSAMTKGLIANVFALRWVCYTWFFVALSRVSYIWFGLLCFCTVTRLNLVNHRFEHIFVVVCPLSHNLNIQFEQEKKKN